jgi:predicted metal-dependent phosphoesterase TrpH
MNQGINIDLHTHSNCSDGSLRPAELVTRAAAAHVEVLALTDHDTTAGLGEARRCAAESGIEFVAGVEISASWRAQSIHVLGLWIDPDSPGLRSALLGQAEQRVLRMRKICARLTRLNLPGDRLLADVEALPGVPTRTHLAQALVTSGVVRCRQDAFRKFLGRGRAAHVAAEWPSIAVVVGWITAAGGIASLAHPARYGLSGGARRGLLTDFAAAGGRAIEVVSGSGAADHIDACAQLAVEFGFEGSVGSDFHDPQLVWNPLGRLAKLPDCVTPVWRSRPQ